MFKNGVLVCTSLFWIIGTANSQQAWKSWAAVEKIFVFGASYVANGFNIDGTPPNAAAGNPFGNPPGSGDTSSGGPNVVEYLTTKYNDSLISTYDFAVSGAVIDGTLYNNPNNDFVTQVYKKFQPRYSNQESAGWSSTNALFIVFFAVNDVYKSYSRTNNPLDAIFATYTRLVEEVLTHQLYRNGARNFLFFNVVPVDRAPGIIAQGPATVAAIGKYIPAFSGRLIAMAEAFNSSHSDTEIFLFDTHNFFETVLDNPSSFPQTASIRNTDGFCPAYHHPPTMNHYNPACGLAVDQYFWLDELHPTYPVHDAAAAEIAKELRR
ncbi:MAG: hypothetical protein Q9219_004215 [cf. Caloplaca sp. 3 TL-2023]